MYCMIALPLDTLRAMHRGIARVIESASTAVRRAVCMQPTFAQATVGKLAQQPFFQQQSQQQ